MKIWGRGRDEEDIDINECDDPDCKSCGGRGWIEVCRSCDKPLSKHSYKQQIKCMTRLDR